MAKPKLGTRRWQSGLITGLVILGLAVAVIGAQVLGSQQPSPESHALPPQVVVNLTQLPQTAPLSGDEAAQLNDFRALVEACPDYDPTRQNQMFQHIEWLLTPALIPPDIVIVLGANPTGKLIVGMATYTSLQWNLLDHAPDSCLLPIGRRLNDMLVAAGEEPFPVFNSTS
jgi:hypothetical protein